MQNHLHIPLAIALLFMLATAAYGAPMETKRMAQFSNDKVSVWRTTIYPSINQVLTMHRHEHDRVLVALTDGLLKITNDKGKVHYLKLKKDIAYYLTKDVANELHKDENMSRCPIKVMVIELQKL